MSKIAEIISLFLDLDPDSVRWMKCASKWLDADSNLMAVLMVIPDHINCISSLIGKSKRAISSTRMEAVFHRLEDGVRNGSLVFEVNGEKAYVSAMYLCDSTECRNATLDVLIDPSHDPRELPRPISVAAMVLPGLVLLIIIVGVLFMYLFRSRAIEPGEEIPIMQGEHIVI